MITFSVNVCDWKLTIKVQLWKCRIREFKCYCAIVMCNRVFFSTLACGMKNFLAYFIMSKEGIVNAPLPLLLAVRTTILTFSC